jgi:hypothetical protein
MVMTALSDEMNVKLVAFAKARGASETEVLTQALEKFFDEEPVEAQPEEPDFSVACKQRLREEEIDSYTLGLQYFGKYSSGIGDLSTTYKQRVKEKIREKLDAHRRRSLDSDL